MLTPGTILDNKYQIEAVIGRGGFGYVYRSREWVMGEAVAIREKGFEPGSTYYWSVQALDASGDALCVERGTLTR